MSNELLDRAEKMRARFKMMESVKGSGHHPDDRDQSQAHMGAGARKIAPFPPCSEHLMPFYDHDDMEQVHFVGPDAERALRALQDWQVKPKGKLATMTGTNLKLTTEIIPKAKMTEVDGQPRLTIWLCDWNDVLAAFEEQGIGLTGGPLNHDGLDSTP